MFVSIITHASACIETVTDLNLKLNFTRLVYDCAHNVAPQHFNFEISQKVSEFVALFF